MFAYVASAGQKSELVCYLFFFYGLEGRLGVGGPSQPPQCQQIKQVTWYEEASRDRPQVGLILDLLPL